MAAKEEQVVAAVTAEVMYVAVGSAEVVIESVLIMEEQVVLVEMEEQAGQVLDIDGMEITLLQSSLVVQIEAAAAVLVVQAVIVEEAELAEQVVLEVRVQTTMVLLNGQLVVLLVLVDMMGKLVIMVLPLKQAVEGIQAVNKENLAAMEEQGELENLTLQ